MTTLRAIPVVIALLACASPVAAQWVNIPSAGVPAPPKGADGKPRLERAGSAHA